MGKIATLFGKLYIALKLDISFSSNDIISFQISKILQISGKLYVVSSQSRSYANRKRQQVNYKVYWTHIRQMVFSLWHVSVGALESIFCQAMDSESRLLMLKPLLKPLFKILQVFCIYLLHDQIKQISGLQSVSYFLNLTCKLTALYTSASQAQVFNPYNQTDQISPI